MARRSHSAGQSPSDERVIVPPIEEMDDETFLRHIDARHAHETKTERALHKFPHIAAAWVNGYRAYHSYLHRVKGDDAYDHEHD